MKEVMLACCLFFLFMGIVQADEVDLAPNSKSAVLISYDT